LREGQGEKLKWIELDGGDAAPPCLDFCFLLSAFGCCLLLVQWANELF
jgi:hypothetical protein